jgi:hypothetical protein
MLTRDPDISALAYIRYMYDVLHHGEWKTWPGDLRQYVYLEVLRQASSARANCYVDWE